MDTLVEHCLVHIANTLNETIRLPIDLSCISDKIINRLAALTHPKTLANTKDRKDKILNKLYKRRVELTSSKERCARWGPYYRSFPDLLQILWHGVSGQLGEHA